MKILAVIPARRGSKRLPGKNIRPCCGKPLIVHTIEAALAEKDILHRVIVSTDDPEIADISRAAGAEVPFLRPTELAGDATPSLPVIQHAARFVEKSDGVRMDWVLLLQPTSPLRTAHDIRAAIERAGKKNCTAVVSVTEAGHSHPYLMRRIEGNLLLPFRDDQPEARRVQDFEPKAYLVNGAIYLTRRDILLEEGSLYGDVVAPYVMPRERSVDVDTEEDLLLAESLLRRRSDGATGRAS
jgi:CMP-N-acetylneuraminic acid synthetase